MKLFACFLLATFAVGFTADSVRAQDKSSKPEPSYTLHLDSSDMALTVSQEGYELHLQGVQKPGSKGAVAIDLHVTLDENSKAEKADDKGFGFTGAPINLSIAAADGRLAITAPAITGESFVGAPVVTFLDLLTLLSRRYDWKRCGAQTFVYLDPYLTKKLATLTVEAPTAAFETIDLAEKDAPANQVSARRLNLSVDAPGLSENRRKVTIWFGANGEALKGTMPLSRSAIRAESTGSAAISDDGGDGLITRYPDGIEPQGNGRFTRVRSAASGWTLTYEGPANLIRSTEKTDAFLNPISIEQNETWRRFRATLSNSHVAWEVPERKIDTPISGEAWFLTHYIMTGIWENRTPFSSLKIGDSTPVTYPTIEWGDMAAGVYSVQRRSDAALTDPSGKPVILHVWRVSSPPYFVADLWTDGHRLVKLASSAGPVIVREGWEDAAKSLAAPSAASVR